MDVLTKKQRSYCMSRIRSKHTTPEKAVRIILRSLGIKYRINPPIFGKPDIKVVGAKAVIFVDGCFWHKCPKHYIQPKTNRLFWNAKITKNIARDRKVDAELKNRGYAIVRIWEHETKFPELVARKLSRKVASAIK
ncbi:very short patch repair endonuclease [Bdellovibrio sp. HCB274]|uniref:very short patch repair endonuclease n=1 Tax=Bdellovibrio sp. HCB274 TaxID=3394361 RepID=UPI0039B41C78